MSVTNRLRRFYAASQYYVRRCGLLLQTDKRGLSVGLSVTEVSPAKTVQPIEMPFGLWTRVGPGNHVLEGVQIAESEGAFLGGKDMPDNTLP